jgi:hypothetical protein
LHRRGQRDGVSERSFDFRSHDQDTNPSVASKIPIKIAHASAVTATRIMASTSRNRRRAVVAPDFDIRASSPENLQISYTAKSGKPI